MSQDIDAGTTPVDTGADNVQGPGTENIAASSQDVSADSSTAASQDVKTAADDTSKAADSPSDVKQDKPVSMLDRVKEILIGKKPASSDASTDGSKEKQDPTAKDPAQAEAAAKNPAEKKASNEAEIPQEFAKHPAWKRIMSERDTFKAQATSFSKVQTFLDTNGISGKDAADTLKITAMIYNDPEKALVELDRIRGDLAVRLGVTLPADLQKEVDEGLISAERAKELSLSRVKTHDATNRADATEDALAQTNSQRDFESRVQLFDRWADMKGKNDPDLAKKLPLMNGILAQMKQQYGEPKNLQEVAARLDHAHKEVTSQIRNLVPQRAEKKASPTNAGGSASVKTQPSTMLQAVQNRLNAAKRA